MCVCVSVFARKFVNLGLRHQRFTFRSETITDN